MCWQYWRCLPFSSNPLNLQRVIINWLRQCHSPMRLSKCMLMVRPSTLKPKHEKLWLELKKVTVWQFTERIRTIMLTSSGFHYSIHPCKQVNVFALIAQIVFKKVFSANFKDIKCSLTPVFYSRTSICTCVFNGLLVSQAYAYIMTFLAFRFFSYWQIHTYTSPEDGLYCSAHVHFMSCL